MKHLNTIITTALCATLFGCSGRHPKAGTTTFDQDAKFLAKHTETIILSDASGKQKVAVLPKIQGRAMTSTAGGDEGNSYGWINRSLLASGKTVEHINAYGGEDRFWIGPEGGQFSIFFKKGVPFDLEHWFTPAPIDTEAFDVVSKTDTEVVMTKDMRLENYSGTVFDLNVERKIKLLSKKEIKKAIGISLNDKLRVVAFESVNKMTNKGEETWKKKSGLLSIWILGMFNPSPSTQVIIPFKEGSEKKLGKIVNDTYFGKVPEERLIVNKDHLLFSGDGQFRSKIGLSPKRALDVAGSYDPKKRILTIVQYNKSRSTDYVNSMWELQDEPYAGDVINSYNDGPAKPGEKPFGPFYELETSSPAAELKPGKSITHIHRTIHIAGKRKQLAAISLKVLGAPLPQKVKK